MSEEKTMHGEEGLQDVIIDLFRWQPGLGSGEVQAALRSEFRRRDLPCPPAGSLRAARHDMPHGSHFVVSGKAGRSQFGGARPRPEGDLRSDHCAGTGSGPCRLPIHPPPDPGAERADWSDVGRGTLVEVGSC